MSDDDTDDARARDIVGRVTPTRGRLQFALYDSERQQYRAVPRSGIRYRVKSLAEFERLAQRIAETVAARDWKDDEPGAAR